MKTLPDGLTAYQQTAEFTQQTIPKGLLKAHQTKAGTWARIIVLEGQLDYQILEPKVSQWTLSPACIGIVEPEIRHQVAANGAVRFYLEFLR